jgi:hypothetical protein
VEEGGSSDWKVVVLAWAAEHHIAVAEVVAWRMTPWLIQEHQGGHMGVGVAAAVGYVLETLLETRSTAGFGWRELQDALVHPGILRLGRVQLRHLNSRKKTGYDAPRDAAWFSLFPSAV